MMCAFPLLPRLSRMIVEAMRRYPEVLEEVLIAASFLSTISPYVLPPGEELEARRAHHSFRDPDGDFVSYLRMFRAFDASPDRGKFCERHYLDSRTLHEIRRIKEQIELIVSSLGMPITGGGPVSDYLCAVSRGLIQFVCIRQERGMFRSLTAEKIQIHPGSVMYRENPQYIVAGEIVRTTRMYAMSVSPLSREILARISPRIAENFGSAVPSVTTEESRLRKRPAAATSRDFTNRIRIGGGVFDIRTVKGGKKEVVLEWDALRRARENIDHEAPGGMYKGLKAVVMVGNDTLMEGEKLELILRIASWFDPRTDLERPWPRKRNFRPDENPGELVSALESVFRIARHKPASRELGFVTLFTDTEGAYWFGVSRGFHTALNESIASLEALADELGEEADHSSREVVGALYRKLSSVFG